MNRMPARRNPDLWPTLLQGGLLIGGFILLANLLAKKQPIGGGGVPAGNSRIKMAQTQFDALYRRGDDMHILWNFSHLGQAQTVIAAFGVASNQPFQFWDTTPPFQTLEKTVELNKDDQWTDYSIDHSFPLSAIQNLGYYDVVSYIRDTNGYVFDSQRDRGKLLAI